MSRPVSRTKRTASHIATLRLQRNAEFLTMLTSTGASGADLLDGVRGLVQAMADCSVPDFGVDVDLADAVTQALQDAHDKLIGAGKKQSAGAVEAVQHMFALATKTEQSVLDAQVAKVDRAGVRARAMRDLLDADKAERLWRADPQKLRDFDAVALKEMSQLVHTAIRKDASSNSGRKTALQVVQEQAARYVEDREGFARLTPELKGMYLAVEMAAARVATVKSETAKWDIRTVLMLDMQKHGEDVRSAAEKVAQGKSADAQGQADVATTFQELLAARSAYAQARDAVDQAEAANAGGPLDPDHPVMQALDAAEQQLHAAVDRNDDANRNLDAAVSDLGGATARLEMATTRLTQTVAEVAVTFANGEGDGRVAKVAAESLLRVTGAIEPDTAEGVQALGAIVAAQAVTAAMTEGFGSEAGDLNHSGARVRYLRDVLQGVGTGDESHRIGGVAEVLTAALSEGDHRGHKPATTEMARLVDDYVKQAKRGVTNPLDAVDQSAYEALANMVRHAEKAAPRPIRDDVADVSGRLGRGFHEKATQALKKAGENLRNTFDADVLNAARRPVDNHANTNAP